MPVLETERQSAARSVLRYRPIDTDQATSGPVVARARRSRADTRVTTAPVMPDDLAGVHTPTRRSTAPVRQQPGPVVLTRGRVHPLVFVSLGLVVMIFLWIGITQAINWGNNELNTLKYGDPRTFQIDAIVGQGDSAQHPSHFLAVNLRGTVTILEFPAGDPGHTRMLASINVMGSNAAQAVVTLRFVDVLHNGKPDMLIDIDGVENVLVNSQGTFRPPTMTEQQQLSTLLLQSGQ